MISFTNKSGFTLIETIIYIGLFGILMVGAIASVRPIMTGAERMSEQVMIENEIALVSRSIVSLIPQINGSRLIVPDNGITGNRIMFTTYTGQVYGFTVEGLAITARVGGGIMTENALFALPATNITNSRTHFDDMVVKRVAAVDNNPAYIEISYVVDGDTYGPIRSYLNF
jgi:type II secretory pathway pseudopilin PulG